MMTNCRLNVAYLSSLLINGMHYEIFIAPKIRLFRTIKAALAGNFAEICKCILTCINNKYQLYIIKHKEVQNIDA